MDYQMINEQRVENDEINLIEYLKILVKRKRIIGLIITGAFVLSVIISLILPIKYASTTSILPPQQEGSLASGLMSQLPGGLGSLAGGVLGSKSPSDIWMGILRSKNLRDAVIVRFDLKNVFNTKTIEATRDILGSMVKIEKSKEDIISITAESKDPKLAATLANAFVEELDRINKNIVTTSGRRTRIFIETRLNEAKEELTKAEDNIKAFQEKNRAVKLDDQSKAIIEAIGTLKGHLMAKEVELQTLLSYATPSNPMAEILKTEVDELKKRLKELEEGNNIQGKSSSKNIFIPTNEIPALSLQYVRLLRDAKVQQTLFELLTQQYEIAKIQEAKDTPTIQVLDVAKVPEQRSKPSRGSIVLLSVIVASILSVFMAFFMEYIERIKTAY